MKLATLKGPGRDGRLIIVSADLSPSVKVPYQGTSYGFLGPTDPSRRPSTRPSAPTSKPRSR